MAIITGTAITAGTAAITAGTIASGAAFAASAAGTAVNLANASKQKKAQQKAEDAASKALEEAREKLEVNYMKGLSIQKEPYELEREAALSGLGQIVQAGQEGEQRGAGVTAGRAAALNQAQQAQTRAAMGRELSGLQRAAAQEESRLQNLRVGLDIKEVEGQTAAAQQAAQNRAAAQSGAFQGIAKMGSIAGQQIPEYLKQRSISGTEVAPEMSFQDVFGTVQQPTIIDPNTVEVLEEELEENNIFNGN
tara:strand:+ start:247 stop:996 length:750 start_codon:yes stop_codon:yes gene_type:complete